MSNQGNGINSALYSIVRRAEKSDNKTLRNTFADSGVTIPLKSIDNQVIYGRRGTGKTHALRYLESVITSSSDIPVYIDLRTIGSPGTIIGDSGESITQKAQNLLIDLLHMLHDSLLTIVIDDPNLIEDNYFIDKLDNLVTSITTVSVDGGIEQRTVTETQDTHGGDLKLHTSLSSAGLKLGSEYSNSHKTLDEVKRSGTESVRLNFSDIASALRAISSASSRRIWILLDEWSSIPLNIQPIISEFLVRCLCPIPNFTVKIGAIEQESNFRTEINGQSIGIELGADFSADLNLDEFLIYEGHESQSTEFFRQLFFKHLKSVDESRFAFLTELKSEKDLVRLAFTEKRSFEELVRAAEGIPRDAINIAAKAAINARNEKISVDNIRSAARQWFQTDKATAISNKTNALNLLNWSIDKVIREKKSRAFLLPQENSSNELILFLYNSRVLHLVRRGYSAKDRPGERYDVWAIDYGAYIDLMKTKTAPNSLLAFDLTENTDTASELSDNIDIPTLDLRSIRRAILDLSEFEEHFRICN
ncbi:hypothetical protein [Actinomyces sp. HMSC08A09]|jgi:hypothetical protein|uniref:hypothetical protein n=1 Tax=Actinomyces sp. HMSC08A09 TaxID=1581133 RepID=UPI000AF95B09|nr:hypothetical protein [Actinomyces sp. HMSC08A09]